MSRQPEKRKFQGHFGDQKWKDNKKQKTNDGGYHSDRGDSNGKPAGGSKLLNKLQQAKTGPTGEEVTIVKKTYEEILKELPEEDKQQRKVAQQVLKNAAREKDPKHYNRLILDMGNTRGLYGYAKQAYKDLLANDLKPNEYTYANLINAAARASEPEDLESFLSDMKARNIPYDLVIYTAIMKLYTTMGDTTKAIEILKQMCNVDTIRPNIRTYHTVLRECCQQNQVMESEYVYQHLLEQYVAYKNDSALKPSPTVYQSMSCLYANNYNIPKAIEFYNMLQEIYSTADADSEDERGDLVLLPFALIASGIAITQACITLNDMKGARRFLLQAKDTMDKIMGNASVQWWKFKKVGSNSGSSNKFGDKKWHEHVNDDDTTTSDPLSDRVAFEHDSSFTQGQFLKQRAQELHNDIHKLEAFMNKAAHDQHTTPIALITSTQIADFPWKPTQKSFAQSDGFSWQQRVIRLDKYITYSKDNITYSKELRKFKAEVCSVNDDMIDYHKIFDNNNKEVIVEVGSGTGEWIVNKCLQFPTTNFIAIEVSPIRIHQIYTRMLLENVKNLIILQGDAFIFFSELVPPKSIHQIYVNFPQPPWFSNWRYRLLNTKFFTLCHQSLVKSKLVLESKGQDFTDDRYGMNGQGFVTIVTDDSSYVYLLLRELFHENGRSKDFFVSMLANDEGKSVNFSTELPPLFGSSYYHRFWQKGQKFRRFYIKMAKNNNLSYNDVQRRFEENEKKQAEKTEQIDEKEPKRTTKVQKVKK